MSGLSVSKIQIIPIQPKDGLVAFASAVINDHLAIGNIAIFTSPNSSDGFRLVYPTKISSTGKQLNCFCPITREAGDALHAAIISEYKRLLEKLNAPRRYADHTRYALDAEG